MDIIHGALNFVYYIRDYWAGDLSIGWCAYGRIFAANILGVTLEKIPTTNNHVENFNNLLKTHQLHKYQNNNYLLRMDLLGVVLIKSITPNILLKRTLQERLKNQLIERIRIIIHFYQLIKFNLKTIISKLLIIYQILNVMKQQKEYARKKK